MIKSKKSQIYGQVFIYILLIVIFGSILVYGIYAIGQLLNRAEKVELERFKIDMKNIVLENREFGSIDVVEMKIPPGFEEVCFINSFPKPTSPNSVKTSLESGAKPIPIILDKIKSGSNDNMFLYPPGTESTFVGKMEVQTTQGSICLRSNNRGRVRFKLEGLGDETRILPIQP